MTQREIMSAFENEVREVRINKDSELHGEPATKVTAYLADGRTVEGVFTRHPRGGFGGVTFAGPKDVVGLMTSKIRAVLDGRAESVPEISHEHAQRILSRPRPSVVRLPTPVTGGTPGILDEKAYGA